MADNNAILGTALDEFVGAVLAKKSDKGFLENVDRELVESEVRTLKEALKKYEEMAGRVVEVKLQDCRAKVAFTLFGAYMPTRGKPNAVVEHAWEKLADAVAEANACGGKGRGDTRTHSSR